MKLLIDTGVLGQICHPRRHEEVRAWFRRVVRQHVLLTRELLYAPITTAMWRRAAALWASARSAGVVTAHEAALESLAAPALEWRAVPVG